MNTAPDDKPTLHPIQVISRRTGLSTEAIRAWERRYGAVTPQRGSNGRRLYSEADLERLGLLKRATEAGRRIGDVATLSDDALLSLVREDEREQAARLEVESVPAEASASTRLQACLEAAAALDAAALEDLLYEAAVEMSVPALLDQLIAPLFRALGEAVQSGRMRIHQEHMATAVARSFLSGLRPLASRDAARGPRVLISTPAGQAHELGALMAAIVAAAQGWRVLYLGANLPADELAAAARQFEAQLLALSVLSVDADTRLDEELGRLRRQLPDTPIMLGGPYIRQRTELLRELGLHAVADYEAFRQRLDALRPGLSRQAP